MNKRLYTFSYPYILYVDLVIRRGSFWVGCHYSLKNRSMCIALLPCVVVRVGRTEYQPDEVKCG